MLKLHPRYRQVEKAKISLSGAFNAIVSNCDLTVREAALVLADCLHDWLAASVKEERKSSKVEYE
jgi:hypothetical protein